MDVEEYAELVRQRRVEKGMTQEDLAEKAGVSVMTIVNAESGSRVPRSKTESAISRILGIRQKLERRPRKEQVMVTLDVELVAAVKARGDNLSKVVQKCLQKRYFTSE